MEYKELLSKSPPQMRNPLCWRLPGAGAEGKTLLYHGAAADAGNEARGLGAKRVLLLIGQHILHTSGGAAVCAALEQAGIDYDIYTDISSEPHFEDIVPGLQRAVSSRRYDAVIGAGGGSVMDMAKLAAQAGGGSLEEILAANDFSHRPLPLILLPTTSGTGSEISPYAVLTVAGKKVFYSSPNLLPTIALIDPLLTVSAPPRITAATAFDAMTHALEGAMARPTAYSEALAVESTAQILQYLPRAVADPRDLEARYNLALASVMGMMSYATGGGLYAHSISYILTLEKEQPHGAGCGFALPYTMAFNTPYIQPLLQKLSARCQGMMQNKADVLQQIQSASVQLGLPASLQALGYTKSDMPRLADKLLSQYERKNNPRQLTPADAVSLFEAMYAGTVLYF